MRNLGLFITILLFSIIFINITAVKSPTITPEETVENLQKAINDADSKLFERLFVKNYITDNFLSANMDIQEFFKYTKDVSITNVSLVSKNDSDATIKCIFYNNIADEALKLNLEINLQKSDSSWLIYNMEINK
ncbi:hypothetical protein [Bacillus sp. ISL-39]|uniref:hypothetical protein n=1 Tax=Bacillus sp. ISL-39 TaxID=2819124 RepID=UPI001BEA8D21|nr:hypothetical protein [Bacillus sp. ISL-39]MBT2640484.1 hypothetical protein [Bacillus sp. ISL-39]